MAVFQCVVLVISVIHLVIGLGFLGTAAWLWYLFGFTFRILESTAQGLGVALIPIMIVLVLITVHVVVEIMTGVLGIAAVCKRRQCEVMSFMVFCILTCVSSAEFLVVGIFSLYSSSTFKDEYETCLETERETYIKELASYFEIS